MDASLQISPSRKMILPFGCFVVRATVRTLSVSSSLIRYKAFNLVRKLSIINYKIINFNRKLIGFSDFQRILLLMYQLLDNPVYNALLTGDAHHNLGSGEVRYFDKDVSPFA